MRNTILFIIGSGLVGVGIATTRYDYYIGLAIVAVGFGLASYNAIQVGKKSYKDLESAYQRLSEAFDLLQSANKDRRMQIIKEQKAKSEWKIIATERKEELKELKKHLKAVKEDCAGYEEDFHKLMNVATDKQIKEALGVDVNA